MTTNNWCDADAMELPVEPTIDKERVIAGLDGNIGLAKKLDSQQSMPAMRLDNYSFLALEAMQKHLGLSDETFEELSVAEIRLRLLGCPANSRSKWTRGECRRLVAEDATDACLEIVKSLTERGPHVIAWDDESDPELARMIAKEAEEFADEYEAK
jgi:hypothetical protein